MGWGSGFGTRMIIFYSMFQEQLIDFDSFLPSVLWNGMVSVPDVPGRRLDWIGCSFTGSNYCDDI